MGGTNVDAVSIDDDGNIIDIVKNPTNREDLFESIWQTIQELLPKDGISNIKWINLSTTVSTNAIVENRTSPVGMIIQSGPGINHDFLACGDENVFISGYIDHRGREVKGYNKKEILKAKELFMKKGIPACAVVSKFSVRNPKHELAISQELKDDFSPITTGHSISGKLNFPRRVFTSYLNSAVYSNFQQFSSSIKKALAKRQIKAPIYVLKADGGTSGIDAAEEHPVQTILSGPAASLMGTNALLPTTTDAVLLDIGGTTTDICFLADGVPLFEPLGIKIDKYNTLVRAIYNTSIGLGGDSSIRVKNGKLVIGPRREGYPRALGGPMPTPSDAMIVLGHLNIGDKNRAYEAMKELGDKLNMPSKAIAEKVLMEMANIIKNKVNQLLDDINSRPVYTVKELLYGKQIRPKVVNIIGGPAKFIAPYLEKKLNIPCQFPENYEVANAVGAALSRTTTEITLTADTVQGVLTVPELGLYEKVGKDYNLEMAKKKAVDLLNEHARKLGATEKDIEPEIIEESSFNMVRGFFTSGKNIRVKTQIRPGLISTLRGVNID